MKSKPNYIVVVVIVAICVYAAIRYVGWLQFYNLPSPSMMPNYPMGKFLIASNLNSPKIQDVVAYNSIAYGYNPGPDLFLGRIVAVGGDEMEIRNGYVYINGTHSEKNLDLAFGYSITQESFSDLGLKLYELDPVMSHRTGDNIMMFIPDSKVWEYFKDRKFERVAHQFSMYPDIGMKEHIKPSWTDLNYGPIEIPLNHFFILGDNRSNSQDSRVRGFIHESAIKGVVLN